MRTCGSRANRELSRRASSRASRRRTIRSGRPPSHESGAGAAGLDESRSVYGARALELRASDIMVRRPVTCQPDDTITRVTTEMTRQRVRHLPVVEGGRLRGIVSIGDIVKHRLDELETEANILREGFLARH